MSAESGDGVSLERIKTFLKNRRISPRRPSVALPVYGYGVCQFYGSLSNKIIEESTHIGSLVQGVANLACDPKWLAEQESHNFKKYNSDIEEFENLRARQYRLDSFEHRAKFLSTHVLRGLTLATATHFERSLRRLLLSQFDIKVSLLCWSVHREFPKNLSVNNIYLEMHFAERDDACCEMVEREETSLKLLIAHQQLAKAV